MTRDEAADGPLSAALRAHGLAPVLCPVLVEGPPADPAALQRVAAALERFDWLVASSARGVRRLAAARGAAWPATLRLAAVGPATARALAEAAPVNQVLVGEADGADALWPVLAGAARWAGTSVLVLSTPGGRTLLADGLRALGAGVTVVDGYGMAPRPLDAIAADWALAGVDAVVVASPRAAETLAAAIGAATLAARRVVAIGPTTAAALTRLMVPHEVPLRASFDRVAALLAGPPAAGGAR